MLEAGPGASIYHVEMTPHRLALGLVLFASRQLLVHGYDDTRPLTPQEERGLAVGVIVAIVISILAGVIGIVACCVCIWRGCCRRNEIHNTVMIANSPGAAPPHQQFPPQHPQWPPGTQLPESSQPPPYYSEPLPVPRKA
ncbi:uncharacterized protein LOC144162765 isoform X2 [Haemaphysalis longicornis]